MEGESSGRESDRALPSSMSAEGDRMDRMATATDVGGMIPKVFVEGSM